MGATHVTIPTARRDGRRRLRLRLWLLENYIYIYICTSTAPGLPGRSPIPVLFVLSSPIVPTPGNLCVSIRVPRHSLLRHSSTNRAQAGTGASCRTNMRSCFCWASLLEASSSCLYPSFFPVLLCWFFLQVVSATEVLNPHALIPCRNGVRKQYKRSSRRKKMQV